MAKELPYFKFEPNAFDSGRIQMCSMEAQGLFVNICCLYWSRLGDLPEKLAMQKLCRSYADAYAELIHEQVISIKDGLIIIEFLDEQLSEAGAKSNQAKEAAEKRWAKYREKKHSMRSHNERNADAMPKEEKRKEKNNDQNDQSFVQFWNLYDKKVGKDRSIKAFKKLNQSEVFEMMAFIPKYKQAQPDKQFRKNPEAFINNKGWLDELISKTPEKKKPANNAHLFRS